jgi:Transposase IS4
VIDDYNHWMGGVDKADQLIAHYKPRIRCRHIWMPLFSHCLDVIRVNCYEITKQRKKTTTQKRFVLDMIAALNGRAASEDFQRTRRRYAQPQTPPSSKKPSKRYRLSCTSPVLPLQRLEGAPTDHVVIKAEKQGACSMSHVACVAI